MWPVCPPSPSPSRLRRITRSLNRRRERATTGVAGRRGLDQLPKGESAMTHRLPHVLGLAAVALLAGGQAATAKGPGKGEVVFVQTNEVAGNRVVVYDRAADGRLTEAGSYATGGLGGVAAPGTESDHLASQG